MRDVWVTNAARRSRLKLQQVCPSVKLHACLLHAMLALASCMLLLEESCLCWMKNQSIRRSISRSLLRKVCYHIGMNWTRNLHDAAVKDRAVSSSSYFCYVKVCTTLDISSKVDSLLFVKDTKREMNSSRRESHIFYNSSSFFRPTRWDNLWRQMRRRRMLWGRRRRRRWWKGRVFVCSSCSRW